MPFIGVQPFATAITATSLDGVTSTAAELNILDGVTSTAAELNYLDITTLGSSEASKVVTADSSGNVGIGTASPSTSLDVVRAGAMPLRVQSTSGTECQINMVNTGGNVQLEAHSGNFSIDADNVGIGTASPNTYANYTTLTLNGATSSALDFEGGGTLMAEVFAAANDLVLQTTNSDGELIFKSAAGSERMRINSTGVVQFENGLSEKYTAVTSSSNATTVDLLAGTNFSHTLTENTTFTFSNPAASGRVSAFTLKLVQDSSASGYTVTWPSSVDWPSATAPTLTATANAVDYFVFITHDGGTNYYGFTAGQALG